MGLGRLPGTNSCSIWDHRELKLRASCLGTIMSTLLEPCYFLTLYTVVVPVFTQLAQADEGREVYFDSWYHKDFHPSWLEEGRHASRRGLYLCLPVDAGTGSNQRQVSSRSKCTLQLLSLNDCFHQPAPTFMDPTVFQISPRAEAQAFKTKPVEDL